MDYFFMVKVIGERVEVSCCCWVNEKDFSRVIAFKAFRTDWTLKMPSLENGKTKQNKHNKINKNPNNNGKSRNESSNSRMKEDTETHTFAVPLRKLA